MQVIRSESDIDHIAEADLKELFLKRKEELAEYVDHFSQLVYFVVFREGDNLADLEAVLGFPLCANRFNGIPYGQSDFTPSWDILAEHPGYYEFVYVLDDSGAGVQVFIAKDDGIPSQLREMCRNYAVLEVDT